MKLIIEDEDIIQKINEHLSPQIRVWGMVRTNNSFSSYQQCDSRIYEYLLPTHCFLPSHPSSFLAKKLVELNDEAEDRAGFEDRQKEVASFWPEAEEKYIRPILDRLNPTIKPLVLKALYDTELDYQAQPVQIAQTNALNTVHSQDNGIEPAPLLPQENVKIVEKYLGDATEPKDLDIATPCIAAVTTGAADGLTNMTAINQDSVLQGPTLEDAAAESTAAGQTQERSLIDSAVKELKAAYLTAKKAYRIDSLRLARVRSCLSQYVGTHNFHNYTIQKLFIDPSAKRVIKTFFVNGDPLIINNTEWLSLKVHGQSFMMHQIRKMVSMLALVIRCGCSEERIKHSYMFDKIMIPKAPGLGLLLERPIFDSYNAKKDKEKEPIEFTKFEVEMEEFKKREIYERMFREEEKESQFHTLFATHDNMKSSQLLYLSSLGLKAVKKVVPGDHSTAGGGVKVEAELDSSDDENPEDG